MHVSIEPLRESDVEDAFALSAGESWNQTRGDWERLLRLDPGGCFGARIDGRLVGTVTTTIHERALAWIGMMIVHPAARRRGIGAALMARALELLDAAGIQCVKLDATPAGMPLYRRLGFEGEVLFERWQGMATPTASSEPLLAESTSLDPVLALDRAAFGADRSRCLAELRGEALAAYVVDDTRSTGFALARPGRVATYLGPIVATDHELAVRLFDAMMARFAGRHVYVDVNSAGLLAPAHLSSSGLASVRPLLRMRRGSAAVPRTPATLCASAGPELG